MRRGRSVRGGWRRFGALLRGFGGAFWGVGCEMGCWGFAAKDFWDGDLEGYNYFTEGEIVSDADLITTDPSDYC